MSVIPKIPDSGDMNPQTLQPYTQWGLPPGALARLGKGAITDIQYSPDGTRLAVATYIGVWLYDAHTCTKLTLLKHGQDQGATSILTALDWIKCLGQTHINPM